MFEDWMSALRRLDVDALSPGAAAAMAADAARLRSALDGLDARLAGVMADDDGAGGAARLRGATRRTQRDADRVARRSALIGAVPAVGTALASGEISGDHVDVLARAAERTSVEAVADSDLLEVARRKPADAMRREVDAVVRRSTHDAELAERHRRAVAARRCVIFDDAATGMTVLHAEFDPVAGARVRAALDAATNTMFVGDGGRGTATGVRRPEQRRADALVSLVVGGETPTTSGGPPSVRTQMIIVVRDDGTGEIPGAGPLPASVVERLACGSDLFGLVLSADGDPLWLGRRRRLASDGQWRALIARDGGCIACAAHPARCEAHHVRWHGSGLGSTDIDNLVLLCAHHHHLVHDAGWRVERDPGGGWALARP